MAVTERLVVLMTAKEKHDLEERAKKAGARSTAEFVRSQVARPDDDFDPSVEAAFQVLRDSLLETIEVMKVSLDQIERDQAQTIAAFEACHGIKV